MIKVAIVVCDLSETQGVNSVTKQIVSMNPILMKNGIFIAKVFDCNGSYENINVQQMHRENKNTKTNQVRHGLKNTKIYHTSLIQAILLYSHDLRREFYAAKNFECEKDNFDCVIFQGCFSAYYFLKRNHNNRSLKVVVMDHSKGDSLEVLFSNRPQLKSTFWEKALRKRNEEVFRRSDLVINICKSAMLSMQKRYKGKFISVINGIKDISEGEIEKEREEKVVFTCVATVLKRKGQSKIIEAILQMKPETRKLLVVNLVGEGDDLVNIKKTVIDNKMQDIVHIHGNLSQEKVCDVLKNTDVFILPTELDTVPVVILEAMSCGLAIISTDIGGIPEMVLQNENGKLSLM